MTVEATGMRRELMAGYHYGEALLAGRAAGPVADDVADGVQSDLRRAWLEGLRNALVEGLKVPGTVAGVTPAEVRIAGALRRAADAALAESREMPDGVRAQFMTLIGQQFAILADQIVPEFGGTDVQAG